MKPNTTEPRAPRHLGRSRRILGGYGPLLAIVAAFLLISVLVPTVAPEEIRVFGGGGQGSGSTIPADVERDDTGSDGGTVTEPGGAAEVPGVLGPDEEAVQGAGTVSGCADRELQIEGDPYSPPCRIFDGDNGGTTWRGVTADTIRVSFRIPVEDIRDFQGVITELTAGAESDIPVPTEQDVRRSIDGLMEYFSQNFELYGRQIEVVEWTGQGSAINEIVGAGQESANADAIRAAEELEVFADVSAFTQPYADALARRGVVAVGAPYLSREWFEDRAPYVYSPFPDCTSLGETVADWGNKRVFPYPASLAGGNLAGRERKVGVVAPDNPEYQQCVDAAVRTSEAEGNSLRRYSYTLDLASMSDQTNNLAAKMRADELTTIVVAADPLLPLLLSSRMTQQKYFPEWIVIGTALTDIDLVGQFYDPKQWDSAFGISLLGEQQPAGSSHAYFAFKSVYPDAEPIFGIELLYYYFYLLAVGIHMAGPDLTPDTLLAGLRAYPGGTGPAGTWGFPEGQYSPYRDAREIRWDPEGISTFNGQPGRYASDNQRYGPGEWPAGDAASGG